MDIQVDQSIKVERTHQATVLGLSNGKEYAVTLQGKTKRRLQEAFRLHGIPRQYVIHTFAACLTLLMWHARFSYPPAVVVDEEYPGYEEYIRQLVATMWQRLSMGQPIIVFRRIGKRSPAHRVAHWTANGRRRVDHVLTYEEISKLVFAQKKNPGA